MQILPRSRPFAYVVAVGAVLLACDLWMATGFRALEHARTATDFAGRLAAFHAHIVELLAVLLLGMWCVAGPRWLRAVGYFAAAAALLVHALQGTAVHLTVAYVSRLAIANVESFYLLLSSTIVAGSLALGLLTAFGIRWIERRPVARPSLPQLALASVLMFGIGSALDHPDEWISDAVRDEKNEFWALRNVLESSPLRSLGVALGETRLLVRSPEELARDVEVARGYGLHFDPLAAQPALRPSIYSSQPPFARHPGAVEGPDVIIFFIEGFSARTINAYGSPVPGLTPNLDRFAAESMRVDSYFNHTAATYRGLMGQLCSMFPLYGGSSGWKWRADELARRRYLCLNHLLEDVGYESSYLGSYFDAFSSTVEMMRGLGFQRVTPADALTARLAGPFVRRAHYLSDQRFVDAAVAVLEERPPLGSGRAPIFTALYSAETHCYKDVGPDGLRYGTGENQTLNTVHNFDDAFGRFWDYLRASKHAQSTILIVTSDHAHFPEPSFIEIAGDDYQRQFIDEIPLLIHDPTRDLPRVLDAQYASSVALAPSLAHYLGLPNRENPFQGRSIFEGGLGRGVAAFDGKVFVVDADGVHPRGFATKHRDDLESLHGVVERLYAAELEGSLWLGPGARGAVRD